jgi:protein-tyrosine phosphatase
VRWLLAPYLGAAWLNSRWWTRACAQASAVVPGVMIGRLPTRAEREALGVRAVVDMSAELPCDSRGIRYVNVAQLDLTAPTAAQMQRAAHAIETALPGPVLVCCALGFSRSAAAVAAWLVASGRARDMAEAVAQVRRARPAVVMHDS